jgi:hypothetical protein
LITTRWFSSSLSDPASRRTPCPPKIRRWRLQVSLSVSRLSPSCLTSLSIPFHHLRPMRRYPHLWISARGLGLSGTSTHLTRQLPGTHYGPLRHPNAPGLSLTGVRLIIPDHAMGLPVLRALSLCTCCRQYPGAAAGRNPRSSHPAVAAFPDSAVGSACTSTFSRLARRSLALRPAHSRGHHIVTAIRRLQPFRYLHDCSDCFRLERIAGWALHPLESAAFSRRTPITAVRRTRGTGGAGR